MIDKIGAGIYETLDGWPVVILCLDAPGSRPVVGYVVMCDGSSVAHSWSAEGKCSTGSRRVTEMDLRPAPRKPREFWVHKHSEIIDVREARYIRANVYTSKENEDFICFREVMEEEDNA